MTIDTVPVKLIRAHHSTLFSTVIGDEILGGKVEECNSRLICSMAPSLGLKLRKISVIPDDIDLIAKETQAFMLSFDVVITSGGIGPTHDDMTFEGVAKAIGEDTFSHPELLRVIEKFYGFDAMRSPTDPRTRLAQVPVSSELIYGIDYYTGRQNNFPVVKVRNVYIMPGVPRLFRAGFEIVKDRLIDPQIRLYSHSLYVTLEETRIAKFLSILAKKYNGVVTIGSYPVFENSYYRVRVVLDSCDEKQLAYAQLEAKEEFGNDLVAYESDPVAVAAPAVYELARDSDSDARCMRIAKAIETINAAFDQFSPSQLVIGFNGGKDCTALLHLVYAVLHNRGYCEKNSQTNLLSNFPKLLYIRSQSVFPELENFVQRTLDFYRLSVNSNRNADDTHQLQYDSLIIYEADVKSSLERLLRDFPDVRAHLTPMCMTDPGWPQILRINPLLSWNYADIWYFIRQLSLPYCSLYDVGYTSIGRMEDTHPNPSLRYVTESGRISYRPAFTLADPTLERSGRQRYPHRCSRCVVD